MFSSLVVGALVLVQRVRLMLVVALVAQVDIWKHLMFFLPLVQ